MEITQLQKKITGGIYLVIDPAMEIKTLLNRLDKALSAGIDVVQVWNNWPQDLDQSSFLRKITKLCQACQIPVLINQDWQQLLQNHDLQGVHFDKFPTDFEGIKEQIGRPFITGITCSGNLQTITLAEQHQLDYVSFCAMFPSKSAGSCDIVMPQTLTKARELTNMPFFVSGGMTPENTAQLKSHINFQGVAVISGILSATHPAIEIKKYKQAINPINNEK